MHGFVRSAIILAACILAAALLLMPVALRQSGSGGLSAWRSRLRSAWSPDLLSEGIAASLVTHVRRLVRRWSE